MGCGFRFTLLALGLIGFCVADDDSPVKTSTATWADKLKKDLLMNYDRNLRPTQYYNVTNVEVNMEIRHVDIDEDNSIFTLSGWLKMNWQDLRLKWEPSDYGGLQSFYIPSYYLWDPEVNMHSTTLETAGARYASISDVRVESSGMHHCTHRLSQKIFCEMNFQRWPFDTQHCSVLLGKSVSTHEDRTLKLNGVAQDRKQFRPITDNPAWVVTDISVETYEDPMEEEGHNFEGLQYGLVIKRKVRIFYSTIVTPAVVFILMTLTSFWLPPGANEKVLLNCVTATLLCIFLRYFTIHLPLLATRTPLVVLFFSHSLYLTAISLILSVVVINIAKTKHRKPIHPYFKAFIALPGVSILVWTGSTTKSVTDEEEWTDELKAGSTARESCSSADEASQGQGADVQHEWIQLTVALERIFFIRWNDDKLKWNPDDYGKLDVIRTNPESVWKPDLVLYNNARPSDIEHYGMTNVLIYNTGQILWVPPTDYHANCKLNLRLWPIDRQICFVKIGSWTFDGYKMNISEYGKPNVDIDVDNNEWSVLDLTSEISTRYYECCTEPYMDIQYNVTLQRQSTTHKAIVVSPAFVIMLLALSVFWLPPNCGEKIILNGIITLIVTVFLIYFATQLPAMSGNTPLIVTFFSTTLYLVAFGTILSVIVLRMSRTRHADPVPRVFKKQLDGCLGSVLGVGRGSLSSIEDKEAAAGGGEIGDAKQRDWCRLAGLIDRLAFVVYLLIFILSTIYYSL